MLNRRLLLSIIIKMLFFSALLFLCAVFINSLFSTDSRKSAADNKLSPVISIEIGDMHKGQIKKARWENREVAILLRQFPERLTEISKSDTLNENLPLDDSKTRSIKVNYFVYLNVGDSGNCPLFYSSGQFKDVCTSNTFDEAGRQINGRQMNSNARKRVEIPPHYFIENTLFVGKWQP